MDRVVFHVDVNSAFLSWSAVKMLTKGAKTDLREVPAIVGGDASTRHGIVLAKSIPAKKYDIVTAEPVASAMRKCPGLIVVEPDFETYSSESRKFIAILNEYTDKVEQFSIDEAFMDMTGTKLLFGEPVDVANRIRERIHEELGFTVNIGISSNKLLAKMASDFKKPDRTHTLFPEEIPEKMWPLPIEDLFGCGKSASARLRSVGIFTIGDLAKADDDYLYGIMRNGGLMLKTSALGLDDSPVNPIREENKGYGHSVTVPFDITDSAEAKKVLRDLTDKVCARVRRHEVKITVLSVSIRFSNLKRVSHQCVMPVPTDVSDEVYTNVCKLFDEKWDGTPIRLLGVSANKVTNESEARQLSLFDTTDYEKLSKVDKAMDEIRSKFGDKSVKRGSKL